MIDPTDPAERAAISPALEHQLAQVERFIDCRRNRRGEVRYLVRSREAVSYGEFFYGTIEVDR